MNYGSQGSKIEKLAAFGKTLSNGTAEMNNYSVYAVTVQDPDNSNMRYTYPAVKGQTTHYLQRYRDGSTHWWIRVELACSVANGVVTITAKRRRSRSLDPSSASGNVTITIVQIRGIG